MYKQAKSIPAIGAGEAFRISERLNLADLKEQRSAENGAYGGQKVMVGLGFDAPEDSRGSADFRWLHIPAGQAIEVTIISDLPLWYKGHWFAGRVRKCEGENCPACGMGVGSQRRWVFQVHRPGVSTLYLLEISESNALLVRSWIHRAGGFRGMNLMFSRPGQKRNGRVEVEYGPDAAPGRWEEVQILDLQTCLEATWNNVKD